MVRLTAVGFVVVLLVGCASAAPTPSPTPSLTRTPTVTSSPSVAPTLTQASASAPASAQPPSPTADARVTGWRADIGQLIEGIESRHPELDSQVSVSDLEGAANELSLRVPTLTDDQLLVEVMRIVAMVSAKGCDAHTGAYVWGGGSYSTSSMPLRLWLFGDDLYVVDALPPYGDLVGQQIVELDGRPISDVTASIDPIVPRDNDETVRLLMPRFVLNVQVLRGLGLPILETITLTTRDDVGQTTDTDVTPIPMANYNDWAGPYGLHLPIDPDVPYLSRIDDLLWWNKLPDGDLYVQFNRFDPTSFADLQDALNAKDVTGVVLDLRHNFGGEVFVLNQLNDVFRNWLAADDAHHLEIATLRNTFSAASLLVAKLASQSRVQLAGEAMGGCPSGWGNNRDFTLAYSGIPISVSTTFNVGESADDPRQTIEPQLPLELTFEEWRDKVDPVLAAHTPSAQ